MPRASLEANLTSLIQAGYLLYYAMGHRSGVLAGDLLLHVEDGTLKLPSFEDGYEAWYSEAMRVVSQIIPDRLTDFVAQYKNDKRKSVTHLTYTISDSLLGLSWGSNAVVADAILKMKTQLGILQAAEVVFKSALVDIGEVLRADLFDTELEAAAELAKQGFVRCGGAIAGVVLEKHLALTCETHGLKTRKRRPTINDLNQLLKDNGNIDTAHWRFVQHLGTSVTFATTTATENQQWMTLRN
ncbi:MAG: hypothetical protein IIC95_06325 [Chloroflexi bacterium]|nr:hypothetical protein [Chloroflexota bacterium]